MYAMQIMIINTCDPAGQTLETSDFFQWNVRYSPIRKKIYIFLAALN